MDITLASEIKVRLIQKVGDDDTLAAAAKVLEPEVYEAYRRENPGKGTTAGLIRYLMTHRHGCFDSETEVLTSAGWKPWPSVDGTELFVTLNTATDEIELQRAERLVRKPVSGPMVRLWMPNAVDALVTPDHNMLAAPRTNDGWNYGLHPAKSFLERTHRIRLGGGLWGGPLHAPEEAELAGFIAADGNVRGSIEFHLRRLRKVEWLNARAVISANGDRYRLVSASDRLRSWAEQTYTPNGDRCLPREILERGDAETIRSLLDGYLAGDGSISPTGKINCSTVSRQMVDDVQEAALKAGMAATEGKADEKREGAFGSRPLYRLTIFRGRNMEPRVGWTTEARQREVSVVDYRGDVHCVTVPNGTLYVRRNGKPMWCGNTPFEHSSVTFFVHAPIFVWREWHRHRIGFAYSDYGYDESMLGQSFNEESGRYKQLDPVFYIPPRDRPMFKVDSWKPGRPKFTVMDTAKFEDLKYYKLTDNLKEVYTISYEKYEENLALGIDPGLARDCLPVGIYSSCWVTCNPRSLMAFLSLRTYHEDAKFVSYPLYEIEEAAKACEEIFAQLWPITHAAFVECGRVAP